MDSNRILNQSHDAQTEIEHLTANLCEAGMEIFDLRAELVAALELSERWRTLAEYRLRKLERREGPPERRVTSASELVEIPGDWHHRSGAGRRWRDEPERRKASSERWELFHRDRRGVATAEPAEDSRHENDGNLSAPPAPSEPDRDPPKWLAKALRPRHFARVTFVVVGIACVTTLIVLGAIWHEVGAVLTGLSVGVAMGGAIWAAEVLGTRHGHTLYRQELTQSRVVGTR
jgi:hypothetical protein